MAQKTGPLVKEAILSLTPQYSLLTKGLLLPAQFFWIGSMIGRKFRLFMNPKNRVPLLAGAIFDAVAGDYPSVDKAARIVFGTASVVKCSEDILRIVHLSTKIKRLHKEFPIVKRRNWEDLATSKSRSPSHVYFARMEKIRHGYLIKRFFAILGEIFKSLALLALHFSDAVTAYRDNNTTSEIFVHGIDLFNKLTSSDSEIVKHLNKFEEISNKILGKIGASWATTALVGLFVLPAKARKIAPSIKDLKENFKHNCGVIQEKSAAMKEFIAWKYLTFLNKSNLLHKVPREFVPELEREYDFFIQGVNDPDTLRFLKKPIFRYNHRPVKNV